jgi:hypothetical protein
MKLSLDKTPAEIPVTADTAAAWAINHPERAERQRLRYGYLSRQIPVERAGLPATDYSAASAWLIQEYKDAHAAGPEQQS